MSETNIILKVIQFLWGKKNRWFTLVVLILIILAVMGIKINTKWFNFETSPIAEKIIDKKLK